MARSNEFTHGGGIGKNIRLMLRALLNNLFFGAFWFGLAQLGAEKVLFGLPEFVPTLCTAAGGTGTLILLAVNLFLPFAHRARGSR